MLLEIITPLSFSVLLTVIPQTYSTAETREDYSEEKYDTHEVHRTTACSCVRYVIERGGRIPERDASTFIPATSTPEVGSVALMFYPHSGLHHVAYVEEVGEGYIVVSESNYHPCTISRRTIELPHERIIGYL